MPEGEKKAEVQDLTKIFGAQVEAALGTLERGGDKEQILRELGAFLAVDRVSFTVESGEIFVVMGLSGSGKSTLIRCINRLISPSAGRVFIDGEDVLAADPAHLREIRLGKLAMVFQHFALFPHKTVAENVEYGLKVRGMEAAERRRRALEWLEVVGLANWADQPPDACSGGMKQRVGLARALAVESEILMMDEPFSALDPLIRRDMQDELLGLQRRFKKSIIFITHDLHEALKLGDRIAIMKEGRFVQIGTPEDIVDRPADPYVAAFTQDVDRSRVITAGSIARQDGALEEASAEAALARFREAQVRGLYLVDGKGRPKALVLEEDVARAVREGVSDLGALARKDFPSAGEDAPLLELFEPCQAGLPIAVVDDQGRLAGVVHPLEVFAQLRGHASGTAASAAPAQERA